jgi:hypothetical protein
VCRVVGWGCQKRQFEHRWEKYSTVWYEMDNIDAHVIEKGGKLTAPVMHQGRG